MVKNVLIGKSRRFARPRIAAGARFIELEFILNESRCVMVNRGFRIALTCADATPGVAIRKFARVLSVLLSELPNQ
jgi:hypothetical protein